MNNLNKTIYPFHGYAPGNYISKCSICDNQIKNVAKLCFVCLECAITASRKSIDTETLEEEKIKEVLAAAQYGFEYALNSMHDKQKIPIGNVLQWLMYYRKQFEIIKIPKSITNYNWIKANKPINEYPIGTKAKAIGGGYWERVKDGWKWFTGSTFPNVGADWSGEVMLPCTINWIKGTPILDKPCIFVSKTKNDFSVWETKEINTGDGLYLALLTGDGDEWGDINDFTCDEYIMLDPIIPCCVR